MTTCRLTLGRRRARFLKLILTNAQFIAAPARTAAERVRWALSRAQLRDTRKGRERGVTPRFGLPLNDGYKLGGFNPRAVWRRGGEAWTAPVDARPAGPSSHIRWTRTLGSACTRSVGRHQTATGTMATVPSGCVQVCKALLVLRGVDHAHVCLSVSRCVRLYCL